MINYRKLNAYRITSGILYLIIVIISFLSFTYILRYHPFTFYTQSEYSIIRIISYLISLLFVISILTNKKKFIFFVSVTLFILNIFFSIPPVINYGYFSFAYLTFLLLDLSQLIMFILLYKRKSIIKIIFIFPIVFSLIYVIQNISFYFQGFEFVEAFVFLLPCLVEFTATIFCCLWAKNTVVPSKSMYINNNLTYNQQININSEKINTYNQLLKDGIITQEEYNSKISQLNINSNQENNVSSTTPYAIPVSSTTIDNSSSTEGWYCTQCGTFNNNTNSFCIHCGNQK